MIGEWGCREGERGRERDHPRVHRQKRERRVPGGGAMEHGQPEDWTGVSRGRKRAQQPEAPWRAAESARQLRADEWEQAEKLKRVRAQAATQIQAASRGWLCRRACRPTPAAAAGEEGGRVLLVVSATFPEQPKEEKDDELLDEAIALANSEREQIAQEAVNFEGVARAGGGGQVPRGAEVPGLPVPAVRRGHERCGFRLLQDRGPNQGWEEGVVQGMRALGRGDPAAPSPTTCRSRLTASACWCSRCW